MSPTDRILRERHLHAMVALDTIDPIAERVRNLLSHGRRITLTDRLTYVDSPPKVAAGLTVHRIDPWSSDRGKGLVVRLKPGNMLLTGFGFAAHAGENDTERDERRRFHAGKSIADRWDERRRDMTAVTITGGLPGDGPARDDQLVIRAWNRDGVCTENVIAFDYGPDQQQIREDAAKALWVRDGRDPAAWDKLADSAWVLTDGGRGQEWAADRNRYLDAVDQVLAIAYGDREKADR
ncbi:hypothetical protein ABZ671_01065 [Micromonospora sp. NPDC006766]|uniref:hypothetical protein n=1 Tax=Micromonospora sp. NPDC006766 TaxID=3154778 RepID=UPI0034112BBD